MGDFVDFRDPAAAARWDAAQAGDASGADAAGGVWRGGDGVVSGAGVMGRFGDASWRTKAGLFAFGVFMCVWLLGWAGLGLAAVVGPMYARSARQWEEGREHIRETLKFLKATEAGREAAAFDTKNRSSFGWIFALLFLVLPILIGGLKGNSPAVFAVWEGAWRPLADVTAHLPYTLQWSEVVRGLGHAERVPYVQHVAAVAYASLVPATCWWAYMIWKWREFAAMGAFDHMVWAPWEDEKERYKTVRLGGIFALVLSVFLLASVYGIHFHGFMIREELLTAGRLALISNIHVNDYAAMGFFWFANLHFLVFFMLYAIIFNYYVCGRMWFPSVKKIALLKERMKNG